jgi:site-specific recombinase XerD
MILNDTQPSAGPADLRTLCEPFFTSMADRGKSGETIRRYRTEIRRHLAWLEAQDLLPTIAAVNRYRTHLQGELELRPRSIWLAFTAIFSFYRWCEARAGVIGLPKSDAIDLPRKDAPQRTMPTLEEIEAVFDAARRMPRQTPRKVYLRHRALLVLMLFRHAGLRRGELLDLNVSHIEQEAERWWLRVVSGKGAQARRIPVSTELRTVLEEWLLYRADWSQKHGYTGDALIPVDSGRRLCERGLTSIWNELLSAADVDRRFTPHGLRHLFASEIHSNGADLKTVQTLLGHQSVLTTEVYIREMPVKLTEAVDMIGATRPAPAPEASRSLRRSQERRMRRSPVHAGR